MKKINHNASSVTATVRVAFVDLLFSWPAAGGADVDLYHVIQALMHREVPVKLFVPRFEGANDRGQFMEANLPFEAQAIPVPLSLRQPAAIAQALRTAVDAWRPDVVFLTHGYALKPWVAQALSHYKLVGRYFAHELMCARDALRFKAGQPCPYDCLRHPEHCRRCALHSLKREINSGAWSAWTFDHILAGAYRSDYWDRVMDGLSAMDRIVVYNDDLLADLGPFRDRGLVIPGGFDPAAVNGQPLPHINGDSKKIIVMTGRVEAPTKGLDVLLAAGALLAQRRSDFHMAITHFDPRRHGPFYSATGWLDHAEACALYKAATIAVVPSLWHEPFGLVAVEAMAAGLPVIAADTGGLRDIVRHGETGFLVPPGDATALAERLGQLLDDPALAAALGAAGRARALTQYIWDSIIARYYIPLLEALTP